jgi:hypothetical protein
MKSVSIIYCPKNTETKDVLYVPPQIQFLQLTIDGVTIEELHERKSSGSCLENREHGSRDPSC